MSFMQGFAFFFLTVRDVWSILNQRRVRDKRVLSNTEEADDGLGNIIPMQLWQNICCPDHYFMPQMSTRRLGTNVITSTYPRKIGDSWTNIEDRKIGDSWMLVHEYFHMPWLTGDFLPEFAPEWACPLAHSYSPWRNQTVTYEHTRHISCWYLSTGSGTCYRSRSSTIGRQNVHQFLLELQAASNVKTWCFPFPLPS